jgi:hypothetical protein
MMRIEILEKANKGFDYDLNIFIVKSGEIKHMTRKIELKKTFLRMRNRRVEVSGVVDNQALEEILKRYKINLDSNIKFVLK